MKVSRCKTRKLLRDSDQSQLLIHFNMADLMMMMMMMMMMITHMTHV